MTRFLCLAFIALASPAMASSVPLPAKPAPAGTTAAGKTSAAQPAPAARTCTIGSFKGTLIPGTSICTKVGGFVRVQGNAGRGTAWQP
jgi:hypothetical protein